MIKGGCSDTNEVEINMEKQISCPTCGASFSEELPRCPYCGTMYYKGSEKEYLNKLNDVKDDLEDLSDIGKSEATAAIRKRFKVTMIILAVIIVLLGGALVLYRIIDNRMYNRSYEKDYLWLNEHTPELDAMYNENRYEDLLEYYYSLLEEDIDAPIYLWEHYNILRVMATIKQINNSYEYSTYLPDKKDPYVGLLAGACELTGELEDKYIPLTKSELAIISPLAEKAFIKVKEIIPYDHDLFEQMRNEYNIVEYDNVKKYVDEHWEEIHR